MCPLLFFLPPPPVVSAIVLFTEITALFVAFFVQTHLVTFSFPFLCIPYNDTLLPNTFPTSCILFPFLSHFTVSLSCRLLCSSIATPITPIFGHQILKKSWRGSYFMPLIESATLLTIPIFSQQKSQTSLRGI